MKSRGIETWIIITLWSQFGAVSRRRCRCNNYSIGDIFSVGFSRNVRIIRKDEGKKGHQLADEHQGQNIPATKCHNVFYNVLKHLIVFF